MYSINMRKIYFNRKLMCGKRKRNNEEKKSVVLNEDDLFCKKLEILDI
jgi:hypothetical protein